MRQAFIITSSKHNYRPFRNPPLGVLYLQTIIEQDFGSDLESSVIDLRAVNLEEAIYHVPEKDVYMYSVATLDYLDTKKIVKQIRESYPKSKHIAGGIHMELFPEESLGVFDAISIGEGEENIKRIVSDLKNSRLKKVYKQQETIDLNSYPYPNRKYLPKSAIVDKEILGGEYLDLKGTSVMFSKGCPFNCYFCANLNQEKTRFRSPKNIIDEIEYLKREYRVEALAIKDDNSIPINRKAAKPFLEAIAQTNIKWRGQSRAHDFPEDIIKLTKESGCVEVAVGVESVSQKVLNIINKRIDLDTARKYLFNLTKQDLNIRLNLIMGLPGEPDDIAEQTIKFVKEIEPASVLLSLFCPVPGSEIYNHPEKFGIKMNYDIPFDDYRSSFGRFDANEKPQMIFEYEKQTPFGRGKSVGEIINEYVGVQTFLRENNFNF